MVVGPDDALALVARLRAAGNVIVFTNGVFDLLQVGHTRYLRQARALGDTLILGVNSDRSVRANTSDSRPSTTETGRAQIVAAIALLAEAGDFAAGSRVRA